MAATAAISLGYRVTLALSDQLEEEGENDEEKENDETIAGLDERGKSDGAQR